ncbi:hypothetical protein [Streptomyces puniciscabiei]|uniref:hypothetical protein n=1 Tax=Streptomyces puniciscabiei TaxID=164348 RepID=UPI00379CEF26
MKTLESAAALVRSAVGAGGQDSTTSHTLQQPDLNEILRRQICPEGTKVQNVALMDWTTMHHVDQICTFELEGIDPFVSIADLNALLCAAIFYDRIAVINADARMLREIEITFGIHDAISDLDVPKSRENDSGNSLGAIFDRCFLDSWREFVNVDYDDPPRWVQVLQKSWENLLPGVQVPVHRNPLHLDWYWSSWRPYALNQLFEAESGEKWNLRSDEELLNLVIDNDVRALTYEHIADVLTSAIAEPDGRGPIVRYVGGVLRSPMQKALRARWSATWSGKGAPPAEAMLNGYWQQHWRMVEGPQPIFPFWLSAVIAECRTKLDLREVLPRWRRRSAGFRRKRADVETAMLSGNVSALAEAQRALVGEVDKLKQGQVSSAAISAGVDVSQALAVTHLPPPLTEVSKALAGPSKLLVDPLTMLILRGVKPHLWFLAKVGRAGATTLKPQADLLRIFDLDAVDASAGSAFLDKVNTIEWAV